MEFELYHYGVKGMKWGIRKKSPKINKPINQKPNRIYGHPATPKKSIPNSKIDRCDDDGKVNTRSFYDEKGRKSKDIHTTSHGNPKQHDYGINGEHVVLYEWTNDGTLKRKIKRNLTSSERKENKDIL